MTFPSFICFSNKNSQSYKDDPLYKPGRQQLKWLALGPDSEPSLPSCYTEVAQDLHHVQISTASFEPSFEQLQLCCIATAKVNCEPAFM